MNRPDIITELQRNLPDCYHCGRNGPELAERLNGMNNGLDWVAVPTEHGHFVTPRSNLPYLKPHGYTLEASL